MRKYFSFEIDASMHEVADVVGSPEMTQPIALIILIFLISSYLETCCYHLAMVVVVPECHTLKVMSSGLTLTSCLIISSYLFNIGGCVAVKSPKTSVFP